MHNFVINKKEIVCQSVAATAASAASWIRCLLLFIYFVSKIK